MPKYVVEGVDGCEPIKFLNCLFFFLGYFSNEEAWVVVFFLLSVYVPCSKIDPNFCKVNPSAIRFFLSQWISIFSFIFNLNVSILGQKTPTTTFSLPLSFLSLIQIGSAWFSRKSYSLLFSNCFFNLIFLKNKLIHIIHSSLMFLFVWFGSKPIFFFIKLQEETKIKLDVDSKYTLEEEGI